MEQGKFRVIKSINLSIIEEQVLAVQTEVLGFMDKCLPENCDWRQKTGSRFIVEAKRLSHELSSINVLLGKSRKTRAINFIGKVYHYLF